jgi:predicted transcriptional regulator
MVLTLHVPPDLEQRLQSEALRRNVSADTLVLEALAKHLPSEEERRTAAIAMLQEWIEEGGTQPSAGDEQQDMEFMQAMDADRPSYRKLFPPEMKGVSW